MADGSSIPYQLRPNKFIDRQIFVELLSKIVPLKSHGEYVYMSMGGKHLVDQEAVYRKIGIMNLYSFDIAVDTVARQNCNRPHFKTLCEELDSGALAGSLDRIMQHFSPAKHMIVWLDFTNTHRLAQLQQFSEVLKRCQAGDVVRITMNANDRNIRVDKWEEEFETPGHCRASKLKEQIGGYFPADIDRISDDGLPKILAKAVSLAVAEAEPETECEFVPILLTSYADGQRMFGNYILYKPR